jgi:hypothetical protein
MNMFLTKIIGMTIKKAACAAFLMLKLNTSVKYLHKFHNVAQAS